MLADSRTSVLSSLGTVSRNVRVGPAGSHAPAPMLYGSHCMADCSRLVMHKSICSLAVERCA